MNAEGNKPIYNRHWWLVTKKIQSWENISLCYQWRVKVYTTKSHRLTVFNNRANTIVCNIYRYERFVIVFLFWNTNNMIYNETEKWGWENINEVAFSSNVFFWQFNKLFNLINTTMCCLPFSHRLLYKQFTFLVY